MTKRSKLKFTTTHFPNPNISDLPLPRQGGSYPSTSVATFATQPVASSHSANHTRLFLFPSLSYFFVEPSEVLELGSCSPMFLLTDVT